jgi:AcrR family transcriptional regulator
MTDNIVDSASEPPRGRNRTATRAVILAAAKAQLAEHGFAAFGVNAIARRAQCDKQLVYRYFGGLDGLVDAIGADLADWVGAHLATPDLPCATSYAERLEQVLLRYIAALRTDPLMRRIIAWEVSEDVPHLRRLAAARTRAIGSWMARMRGDLAPPPGLDAPALNAILFAAVQHLVLSAAATGQFLATPLQSDADWQRIVAMLAQIIHATHDPKH